MRKSKRPELTPEVKNQIAALAETGKNAMETIKKNFALNEQEVLDVLKSAWKKDKVDLWQKQNASKPKVKIPKVDHFDDELEGKYYIKNKFD